MFNIYIAAPGQSANSCTFAGTFICICMSEIIAFNSKQYRNKSVRLAMLFLIKCM